MEKLKKSKIGAVGITVIFIASVLALPISGTNNMAKDMI